VFCTEQNKISQLKLGGPHALFQALGPGLMRPADMIPCLQDLVLEVLSDILHCWLQDLVSLGHRQGSVSAVVQEEGCLTQRWVS
jgi:hypothetical protein